MLKKLFGGKKDEFFIQMDDSKTPIAKAPEIKAPVESPEPKVEALAAPKSTKKSIQKTATKASAPTVEIPAPRPEPVQVEFANQYLITQTLVRRLPGPSLNKFKDMARQVKTR